MLDADIKQRIDNARQVLVGVIPDPKGQIEFITAALIYKFLADSDARAEKAGDRRAFFVGDYARFDWRNLLDTQKAGEARLLLYEEALKQIARHPDVPASFRAIFGGAALPFRDARTLNLFLTEIDGIACKRAEDMGTPYEYLLSIMGANQGAGQFRTPQHIIDFIVDATAPQKGDRLCDPACGTAGFLIAAHRHIMLANGKQKPGDQLTPSERRDLTKEWRGYDIDPGMTRLAMANAFVHGIRGDGMVRVYDSLTNADHWNEKYDVILANPPFMSPKGGIRPHNLFAVQASRAEVLFADYIGEHLSPNGRAGIVVPEGVIFQGQKAYKQLRKKLVEEWGLYAVVSLPPGVFQPYSGVKTSVLLLDRKMTGCAKILFVNIASDGFDPGAQRRPINSNDMPQAQEIIRRWRDKQTIAKGATIANAVAKDKIAEDEFYDLTGDRYRTKAQPANAKWPMARLGEVCDIFNGLTFSKSAYKSGGSVKMIKVRDFDEMRVRYDKDENGWIDKEIATQKYLQCGDTLMINAAHSASHVAAKIGYVRAVPPCKSLPSGEITIFRAKSEVLPLFLNSLIRSQQIRRQLKNKIRGIHIYPRDVATIPIPLPPLEVQQEIAAEIDGWQKVITGAQQVIDNWRPQIAVNADWQIVRLGEVCELKVSRPPKFDGEKPYYDTSTIGKGIVQKQPAAVSCQNRPSRADCYPPQNAVGFAKMKNTNKTVFIDAALAGSIFSTGFQFLAAKDDRINPRFLFAYIGTDAFQQQKDAVTPTSIMGSIALKEVANLPLPLPPQKEQQQIAAQIDAEQQAITACRNLIDAHAQKIERKISALWDD